jgi:hypothetical protein
MISNPFVQRSQVCVLTMASHLMWSVVLLREARSFAAIAITIREDDLRWSANSPQEVRKRPLLINDCQR